MKFLKTSIYKNQKAAGKAADLPQLFNSINWEGENSLSLILRQIILRACREVIGDKPAIRLEDVKLEHPNVENYGDYSTNLALILAGRTGMNPPASEFARRRSRAGPRDLAEKIVSKLNEYIKTHQSISSLTDSFAYQDNPKGKKTVETDPKTVSEVLENASTAGPGFVNMTIRNDYLISQLVGVINIKEPVISSRSDMPETGSPLTGKKIMVEFAHPNTHKEFHIGHLRNISIGESVIRILEAMGADLFRANYEGDVGLHVAKAIWGVREKISAKGRSSFGRKRTLEALRELNPANKAKFLGEGYALGSKLYDEDESVKKEIIELNKAIYEDPKKIDLWEETRRWSLDYFETVYKRLGSHFDRYYFESEVEARGKQMVIDGIDKGIFVKDKDGSIYFPGEKYGLNNCVFVTRENYATYEGKDIALESLEFEEFSFDVDVHVVAHEQKNFFQIAFKALEIIDPHQKGRQFHLAYGMVNLKGGKLSSRTGQVITADWLIDEVKKRIKEIMEKVSHKDTQAKNDPGSLLRELDPGSKKPHDSAGVKETEDISEKVAVAAVKYSMLKVNPKMDIAFDLEESVSFDGDSGPYLMYTYARCKSVLRKSGLEALSPKLPKSLRSLKEINTEEFAILRTLYRFPEVVSESTRTLSPNLICTFLFDLAQKYNLFYNKHSILNPSLKDTSDGVRMHSSEVEESVKNLRLSLTSATAKIIKQGLYLLGIETVERM